MMATGKKVKVKKVSKELDEVVCYDLTYGYIADVENGVAVDDTISVVENGTDFTRDEIRDMRISKVKALYGMIMYLTYPQVFNEDGTRTELPLEGDGEVDDETEDKKKV